MAGQVSAELQLVGLLALRVVSVLLQQQLVVASVKMVVATGADMILLAHLEPRGVRRQRLAAN